MYYSVIFMVEADLHHSYILTYTNISLRSEFIHGLNIHSSKVYAIFKRYV